MMRVIGQIMLKRSLYHPARFAAGKAPAPKDVAVIRKQIRWIVDPRFIEPWLDMPNAALGNQVPRELLKTQEGLQQIRDALDRVLGG